LQATKVQTIFFLKRNGTAYCDGSPAFRSNAAAGQQGLRFRQHNHFNRGYFADSSASLFRLDCPLNLVLVCNKDAWKRHL